MFTNIILAKIQNSKFAKFLSDSLIFQNIDKISFALLVLTILSTTFMSTDFIGLFAILFSTSCLFKLVVKKGENIELSFINKILIIYFLFIFISLMGASYFALSLKGIIKTVIYLWFYFSAIYFLSSNKKRILPIVAIIALCVSFEGIIGIIQNMSHVQAIATWQDTSRVADPTKVISRAYGTLKPYNPNLLAGYLIAGLSSIFAIFSIAYLRKNKKLIIISSIFFLTTFYAVFVTGSRGAYLGLLGFLAVIFSYLFYIIKKRYGSFKQIKTKYKAIIASLIAFFAGVILFIPSFSQRLLSVFAFRKDSSISFRMNVYEACYQMFLDNRFLGIGVGNKNFREIYGLYMKTGFDALGSYCVPLEIAVESGIFALLSFVFFIVLAVIRCVKYVLNEENNEIKRIFIFSVLLTITSTMFHGFFDTIFFRPQVQIIFWTNIAIFHSITIEKQKLQKFKILK